ncbi:MAG: iron ABC transporter permease [Coriobacteriales bacterium]|nr:iron ABC transporter permease [Coriobacteriales bacterium]
MRLATKNPRTKERPSATKGKAIFLGAVAATVLLAVAALFVGKYDVDALSVFRILVSPFVDVDTTWSSGMETVILQIRLPRVLAALMVGGALSLSGASYQSVFNNPLVAPDLLGATSGACVGAALGIIAHAGAIGIQLLALSCGLLAVFAAKMLSQILGDRSTLILVLSGIVVSGFAMSLLGLIKYGADPESELTEIVYWQLGSLSGVEMQTVLATLPGMLLAVICLLLIRWRIGLLGLGDKQAGTLGVNVKAIRNLTILSSTLLTALAVCISGTIGWIGLVIPHLCRLLVGADTAKVLPLSLVVGALFLLVTDTITRTITTAILPLSVIIGFIGTPLFAWLIFRQRHSL